MLSKLFIVSFLVSSAMAVPAVAAADNDPPPLPNVNTFPPISPVDYTAMDGTWYAFGAGDLTCVIQKTGSAYGCSGPIPAAPGGANMVSSTGPGEPSFASTSAPVFAAAGQVKPLPPQSRLAYRNIACAIDGSGATICMNTSSQHGFVLTPAGSFTV